MEEIGCVQWHMLEAPAGIAKRANPSCALKQTFRLLREHAPPIAASRVVSVEVLEPERLEERLQAPLQVAVAERFLRPLEDVRVGRRKSHVEDLEERKEVALEVELVEEKRVGEGVFAGSC